MSSIYAMHAKNVSDSATAKNKPQVAAVPCIFPSIWSFTAITLLLHEIGHVVWHEFVPWAKKMTLTKLILATFNPTWKTPKEEISAGQSKLCSEVAADTFAALVGGHAFGASMCGFFLTKKHHWQSMAVGYPDIGDRIKLVRMACECIAQSCPGRDDSYWKAIDGLREHLDRKPTTYVHRQKADDNQVKGFVEEFRDMLRDLKVVLADRNDALPNEKLDSGPPTEGKSIRGILALAAKFRNDCKDDGGEDYVAWERAELRKLMRRA